MANTNQALAIAHRGNHANIEFNNIVDNVLSNTAGIRRKQKGWKQQGREKEEQID